VSGINVLFFTINNIVLFIEQEYFELKSNNQNDFLIPF